MSLCLISAYIRAELQALSTQYNIVSQRLNIQKINILNRNPDSFIDLRKMAEQYQIMAIDSRDTQTNPKTEEQKPEPQKPKNELVCPSPRTTKVNMKKTSKKTVSQFTKVKKSNSKSSKLDQKGKDISSEKQQIDTFSIKPSSDK